MTRISSGTIPLNDDLTLARLIAAAVVSGVAALCQEPAATKPTPDSGGSVCGVEIYHCADFLDIGVRIITHPEQIRRDRGFERISERVRFAISETVRRATRQRIRKIFIIVEDLTWPAGKRKEAA